MCVHQTTQNEFSFDCTDPVICNGRCYYDEQMNPFCLYCNTNTIHIGNICYKRVSENYFLNTINELDRIENNER